MSGDKLINEILDSVWNRINNDKSDNEKNIKVIKFNKRYNYKTIEGKAVEHYIISDEKEISNSAVLSKNILLKKSDLLEYLEKKENTVVLKNKTIFLNRESKKMEIPIYLESSIRPLIHRDIRLQEYMKDPTHDLKYRISPISLESSIQLLMKIGDYDKQGKLIHKFFRYIPYSRSIFEDEDFLQNSVKLKDKIMDNLLTPTVPLYMIEIIVDNFQEDLNFYKEFVNSLVFNMNLINYKRNNYRTVDNLDDYINSQIKIIHYSKKELGVPKLKYTKQLTDLYSAGSWTDNPFTSFINYYQIIEYFFNEIPDNRLFKMVQKQITSPLFSYNRKNDMNELNSLEIVLDYFLDIKMIKKLLTDDEIKYYSKSLPKFISGDKKEVCFNINNFDENRYENIKCLARRIYSIRNALVHNKENSQNNYNPQYHYKMLLKEVPLIKAIASLIIIKSGHTF